MKNFFVNFFENIKFHKKVFFVSFASSLGAVGVLFLIFFLATRSPSEPPSEDAFVQVPDFSQAVAPVIIEEPEEEECEIPPYHVSSVLTGTFIHEETAARRPLAFIINNIRQSLPQSGIASADIVYEVLAEGDVTRFIAIFQSYVPEKIGSIRSARDYFIDFAFNHDAIFVFHGASPSGQNRIRTTGITNLDGGRLEGQVFWRDRSFPEWWADGGTRSMEHSSFTGREAIDAHIEENEIRNTMDIHPAYGFNFGEITETPLGEARHITVPFSQNYTRFFIYDEEQNMYLLENRRGPHMDAETQEQVAVSNILIQFAQMSVIAGDAEGRRNVQTLGEGRGYLITNGEFFPVLWQKDSHTTPTRWTFENGMPMLLSPGRTWICVFQSNGTITIEGAIEEESSENP
ncbi:MAG: DUF3048 domain-containing protein [Defluviitaleaceae bacterium]|nr:DUF3048 domain-containing protein [Defluviitaleaceae bacterium]